MSKPFTFPAQWSQQTRDITVTVICAVASALAVIVFMTLMNQLTKVFFLDPAQRGRAPFLLTSLLAITVSSLLVGFLLHRFCPEAAGSGVPQLKAVFWKELGFMSWRPVWVKFLAGAISIGGGASLGREGPSVYIGGGIASLLAGRMGAAKRSRRAALVGGAAAALAAAFNTPLAGVTFILEEVIHDFGSRLLGRVILSSILGALLVHALLGPQPAFDLPTVGEPRWRIYLAVLVVSLMATGVAGLFQSGILKLRARGRTLSSLPDWLKPAVGGWITWVLGAAVFIVTGHIGVFGLGYTDLSQALTDGLWARTALLLLVAKLIATIACYGTGGCGGIFSPTLFLGAMTGFSVAGLFDAWMPFQHDDQVLLAAVGMCACFGAVVRAPWTALLIVFEMTHQFAMVPALLLGTLVSQALIRRWQPNNFYDAVLLQDGHALHIISPPRNIQDWQNLPVSTIANTLPVTVDPRSAEDGRLKLKHTPFNHFPAVSEGKILGVISREELASALQDARPPRVDAAPLARPDQTIREVADLFIQSPQNVVLIAGTPEEPLRALLTLHDLLRAQTAVQE